MSTPHRRPLPEPVDILTPTGETVRVDLSILCCPACKRPLADRMCCWRCSYRSCERCGRNTASCFIALCLTCDLGESQPCP